MVSRAFPHVPTPVRPASAAEFVAMFDAELLVFQVESDLPEHCIKSGDTLFVDREILRPEIGSLVVTDGELEFYSGLEAVTGTVVGVFRRIGSC